MDIANREINEDTKSLLTKICSSITIVMAGIAMILSAKYYVKPRQFEKDPYRFRSNKFFINQNICGWLIVSHLLVMFGMDLTEHHIYCLASSLLLFFSLLCTFTFIFMMLLLLYRSTSESRIFISSKAKQFSVIAYSFPVLIVSFSVLMVYFTETNDLEEALTGEYL